MKVKELVEILKELDQEMDIMISSSEGTDEILYVEAGRYEDYRIGGK